MYRVHVIYNCADTYISKVIQAMTFHLDVVSLKRSLIYFNLDFLSVHIEFQQYGRYQPSVENLFSFSVNASIVLIFHSSSHRSVSVPG